MKNKVNQQSLLDVVDDRSGGHGGETVYHQGGLPLVRSLMDSFHYDVKHINEVTLYSSENAAMIVDILSITDPNIRNFLNVLKGKSSDFNVLILSKEEEASFLNFIETLDSGQ